MHNLQSTLILHCSPCQDKSEKSWMFDVNFTYFTCLTFILHVWCLSLRFLVIVDALHSESALSRWGIRIWASPPGASPWSVLWCRAALELQVVRGQPLNLKESLVPIPDDPWCWNIYLQNWVIYGVDVGQYTSTMDHLGIKQPHKMLVKILFTNSWPSLTEFTSKILE